MRHDALHAAGRVRSSRLKGEKRAEGGRPLIAAGLAVKPGRSSGDVSRRPIVGAEERVREASFFTRASMLTGMEIASLVSFRSPPELEVLTVRWIGGGRWSRWSR